MHISVLDMGCANSQTNISLVVHIIFYNRSCIEAGTVIEYCILEEGVSIGRNCLLSNLHVPVSLILCRGGLILCSSKLKILQIFKKRHIGMV